MHICFATLDYPTSEGGGGVATVTRLLARALVDRGHQVSVIRLGGNAEPYIDEGVEVYTIDQGPWHYYLSRLPLIGKHLGLPARELERSWNLTKQLRALHQKQSIDVIEFSEEAGFFMAFSSLRKNCIYLARLHGTEYAWTPKVPGKKRSPALKLQRALQRYFLRCCSHLVGVSEYYKNDLQDDLGKKEVARIRVMENPLPKAYELPDVSTPRQNTQTPTFLFCNRIQDSKGIDVLIKSLGALKKQGKLYNLTIAGNYHPTWSENEFQKLLDDYEVADQIEIIGHVSPLVLRQKMLQHTAVVVPSYYETFGMVGLEALQVGVPLIHTKVGIMGQALNLPGLYLVAPNNPKALGKAMELCVNGSDQIEYSDKKKHLVSAFLNQFQVTEHLSFFEAINDRKKRN